MKSYLIGLALVATGCPSVTAVDTTVPPFDGPTVEFDPAAAHPIIPFPNNLALDPTTGKVKLPAQCNESATQTALRTGVLNTLDGFGTYEAAMQLTTNGPAAGDGAIDMTTVDANVVMFQRTRGMTALDPAGATPIPTLLAVGTTTRFTQDCAGTETVNAITVVPLVPLEQHSTYVIAVLDGLKNANGVAFLPSPTWALVRQKVDPVTVDASGAVTSEQTPLDPNDPAQLVQLIGLDQLWKAHAHGLEFLDSTGVPDRARITVAWEVTTQTTTDPLDPSVAGSPANVQGNTPFLTLGGPATVASIATTPPPPLVSQPCNTAQGCSAFMAEVFAAGGHAGACASLPCGAVGEVYGTGLVTIPFQVGAPNPLNANKPIPGQWSDPVHPAAQPAAILQVLAFIPSNAVGPGGVAPPNGWPVVVFGHGLGRAKEDLFAIASQLAGAGFASIAIDFQAHGSRAIQISNDAALMCDGTPTPGLTSPCFAPFFSIDIGTGRDNIRQTVLDLQRLVRATKACGASGCTSVNASNVPFSIDPAHITYMGQSLGGIIGSITTAVEPDFQGAVLNVSGMGWVDVLQNTQTLEFICPLVDQLITAGILMGDPWNGLDVGATGLCTTNAWKTQPGYQQFAQIGQWVLDPADPANFSAKLATKRFLLQEVVGDLAVPNIATDDEGALTGFTAAGVADVALSGAPPPSAAITMPTPAATKWVRYPNLPPNAGIGFPGNTFVHGSLLAPANGNADGLLGTARMQTDAITYLHFNN